MFVSRAKTDPSGATCRAAGAGGSENQTHPESPAAPQEAGSAGQTAGRGGQDEGRTGQEAGGGGQDEGRTGRDAGWSGQEEGRAGKEAGGGGQEDGRSGQEKGRAGWAATGSWVAQKGRRDSSDGDKTTENRTAGRWKTFQKLHIIVTDRWLVGAGKIIHSLCITI